MGRFVMLAAVLLGVILGIVGMLLLKLSSKETLALVVMLACAGALSVLGVERWLGPI